ncbi:MAG TPA: hypothetical protein PLI95_20400 [Polyangiaceae bacterium]|nr:hypothetical protein [Polyangiaceae bacterium]
MEKEDRYLCEQLLTSWTLKPQRGWLEKTRGLAHQTVDERRDGQRTFHLATVRSEESVAQVINVFIWETEKGTCRMLVVRTPRPKGDPPPEVLQFERDFGGAAGLAALLSDATEPGVALEMDHHTTIHVDGRAWDCPALRRRVSSKGSRAPFLELGARPAIHQIGVRYPEAGPGSPDAVDIAYDRARRCYHATITSRGPLDVEDAILGMGPAREVTRRVFETLFVPARRR